MSCCCYLTTVFPFWPIEKECDLNKQHRVLDPERKKLCSQELICNVNPVSLLLFIPSNIFLAFVL